MRGMLLLVSLALVLGLAGALAGGAVAVACALGCALLLGMLGGIYFASRSFARIVRDLIASGALTAEEGRRFLEAIQPTEVRR